MIDTEIRRLSEQDPDHLLDRLEADIWLGVAERVRARRGHRAIVACQAAVMMVALMGSVGAGVSLATAASPPASTVLHLPGMELTPSHLLMGDARR